MAEDSITHASHECTQHDNTSLQQTKLSQRRLDHPVIGTSAEQPQMFQVVKNKDSMGRSEMLSLVDPKGLLHKFGNPDENPTDLSTDKGHPTQSSDGQDEALTSIPHPSLCNTAASASTNAIIPTDVMQIHYISCSSELTKIVATNCAVDPTSTDAELPKVVWFARSTASLRGNLTLEAIPKASISSCPTPCNTVTSTPTVTEFPSYIHRAEPVSLIVRFSNISKIALKGLSKLVSIVSPPFHYFGHATSPIHYGNDNVPASSYASSQTPTVPLGMPGIHHSTSHGFSSGLSKDSSNHDAIGKASSAEVPMVTDGLSVDTWTRYKYLALYFLFNLSLTLFNKKLMVEFSYPYLLTGLHAAFGCLGCSFLLKRRYFKLNLLSMKATLALYAFSVLYTLNIAVSNISLNMVTIPFHQTVRATTPFFTVLIYSALFQKSYPLATYVTLVPVIVGVGFAVWGDYSHTPMGFVITLVGAFLASVKTIATNCLQTGGVDLSAMEILYRMSPLALTQSLVYAHLTGEAAAFYKDVILAQKMTAWVVVVLALNGLLAFGLNVVSFATNKKVGALTMTVAGNVKQVFTVMLGVGFFNLRAGVVNAIGCSLTIVGGFLYAIVEMHETHEREPTDEEWAAAFERVMIEEKS